jgi:hypothetical protein
MMKRASSPAIKKYALFISAAIIAGCLISLASTAFFANKVVNQLKELKVDQPLQRNEQVQKMDLKPRY